MTGEKVLVLWGFGVVEFCLWAVGVKGVQNRTAWRILFEYYGSMRTHHCLSPLDWARLPGNCCLEPACRCCFLNVGPPWTSEAYTS